VSHTDHDPSCQTPHIKADQKFRPIESGEYGTPVGAPFSRLTGGKDPADYWTNDTTPVQITDAICEPTLDLDDPNNPEPHRYVTALFPFWGQILAHDFALQKPDTTRPFIFSHLARNFPGVQPSLSVLDEYGFEQINTINPYLDASVVYGTTNSEADSLRTLDGTGRLNMSSSIHHGGALLPLGPDGNFTAGDIRARENFMLTAVHTLLNREHNWWAAKLATEHPLWSDDKLYFTARHIVAGEFQSITYNEWLPILLGTRNLYGHDACFHRNLRLTVRNEMNTAAMRIGHSLVPNFLEARDITTGAVVPGLETSFTDSFMQSLGNSNLYLHDIDTFLLGSLYQRAQLLDTRISGVLIHAPSNTSVFNLGGFNIARGRDHGLPSFQNAFEYVYRKEFRSIRQDITRNDKLAQALESVYDNGNDPIDLWIGILSEDKLDNAMVGRVGAFILAEQFAFFRNADPYYYEWDEVVEPWKEQIQSTRIVDLLRRNTNIDESLLHGRSFFY
jgi:peroxidase